MVDFNKINNLIILEKYRRLVYFDEAIQNNLLTFEEEMLLVDVSLNDYLDKDILNYLANKQKLQPKIEKKIFEYTIKSSFFAWEVFSRDLFLKFSKTNRDKICKLIVNTTEYAQKLLYTRPNSPYRSLCIDTLIKKSETARFLLEKKSKYWITQSEENKCVEKMANFKVYLKFLLEDYTLTKKQKEIIIETVIKKQNLELIKMVWEKCRLTPTQKEKLEPYMVAIRMLKSK